MVPQISHRLVMGFYCHSMKSGGPPMPMDFAGAGGFRIFQPVTPLRKVE